jgi:hypothetical protein
MTLLAQIDHMQILSAQAGPPTIRDLAAAAHAETIAAAVELTDAQHFTASAAPSVRHSPPMELLPRLRRWWTHCCSLNFASARPPL